MAENTARQTRFQAASNRLRRRLDLIQPPNSLILLLTAVAVGVGTGLGAVVFIWLLEQINQLTRWLTGTALVGLGGVLPVVLVMATAGLVVGWMVTHWAREAKGHGVPEVMEAVAIRGGRIRTRVAAVKVIASSITIGTGGSAGREGPIVQVGAALGSTVGQLLRFSDDRVKTMVACGSAAGIAATFNAPIAGSIFALEVILGRFTTRYFGAVVISSVSAAIVSQSILGSEPAFAVPAYRLESLAELPLYVLLGAAAALVAFVYVRLLYSVEGIFDRWVIPPALKAAVGMAVAAVVGVGLTDGRVLGPGLAFIGEAIADDFSMGVGLMLLLLVAKLVATSFTLGSGNSGGVFAPSLYLGAVLGGIVGTAAQVLLPGSVAHPGAFAIVGMAAVFAAAARAPITAVLIVFEMSNDYKLILPLMLATVLATLISELLLRESIYTLKLKQKGITLQQGRDIDLMQGLQVREAMTRDPYVVEAAAPLDELARLFQVTHSHSFPVVDGAHALVGMVSISDYERAVEKGPADGRTVADIATMDGIIFAYEDEPISTVLQRLGVRGVNKVPVVARADPGQVIGVVRRHDIVKAYNLALMKRAHEQADTDRTSLRHIDGTRFIDLVITATSPAANRPLATVASELPVDCVVVSIRRHGSLLIPHGNTIFQPGDQVSIFARQQDDDQVRLALVGQFRPPDEAGT